MFHVKHIEPDSRVQASEIQRAVSAVGVVASTEQCELLAAHANYVLETNTRMNLTRITEAAAVVSLHIVDSLAFTAQTEPLAGRIVDIGAGAGYPGIPLAVLGHDVWLCESVKKKAAFLEDCVRGLGLKCTVQAMRAEELAAVEPGGADVVVARALSSLAALVELAAPLLTQSGRLIALKGTPDERERAQGVRAAKICGLALVSDAQYQLPGGESRSVYVYERRKKPSLALPRGLGMAQRHTLGGDDS